MELMLRKRFKSSQWDKNEKQIVISLFNDKKSFEEISAAVNNYLKTMHDQYEFVPARTPIAVAYQCRQLKLITPERLKNYVKRYKSKIRKDRIRDIYSAREKVFERDLKRCVVCYSIQKLTYCHIIPFKETRKNEEMNAITLCEGHHKEFDKNNEAVVKKVYEKMRSYYDNYSEKYVLNVCCGVHWHIDKKCS